jgi:CheY-like chemotaxis protein
MKRILLVDDDPDILDIIRLELEDDPGSSVDACRSGEEALGHAEKQVYDVIVSDLRMPGMDGAKLVKTLRNQGCHSLIIIYSGQDMGSGIREALESGANYYLSRTGDPETEFAELRELINKPVPPQSAKQCC